MFDHKTPMTARTSCIGKVTFDSNVLEKATRPERYPNDPLQSDYRKIHDALKAGKLKGYFSQTIFTLEGIQNKDRVDVLGSTRLESRTSSTGENTITISLSVQQDRQPLHSENDRAIQAALGIGMRALRGPARMGDGFSRKDVDGTFYEPDESINELVKHREKANEVDAAITKRGVGRAIALELGLQFSARDGMSGELWLRGLKRARDEEERRKVQKAISEWADAESIASHIGYEIDFFCTNDHGKSANRRSIFDLDNRTWLTRTYGVVFVTPSELIQEIGI